MRDLTGTTAATEKDKGFYRVVWLVELDVTELDGDAVTLRYASREYTLSGAGTYSGGLMPQGIRPGWATLRDRGGLASVGGFDLDFAAGDGMATTLAAYVLDNAPVRLYVTFVTGTEDSTDRIQLQTGVVEGISWTPSTITVSCIDASDRDWREVPTHRVNLADHPYAPMGEFGQVVPVTYGNYEGDLDDPSPTYAATRCLDIFLPAYTAGYRTYQSSYSGTGTRLYEWIDEARMVARFAYAKGYDEHWVPAVLFDPSNMVGPWAPLLRMLRTAPVVAAGGNDVASWRSCVDNDTTTHATIAVGETLSLEWPGLGTPGTVYTEQLVVPGGAYFSMEVNGGTTGAYAVSITYNGEEIHTFAGTTGVDAHGLQDVLGDALAETWHLENLAVTVEPTGASAVEVARIYLDINHYGHATKDSTAVRRMFLGNVDGWQYSSTYQNFGFSGLADGPVAQLAAVLSGKDMFNLPEAAFDSTTWTAARAARDAHATAPYNFRFQLLRAVDWSFWDALCFEAGLHLFLSGTNTWKLIARDPAAASVCDLTEADIALTDPQRLNSEPDVQASLTPTRDVVNEVVLRYDYDPVTERHRQVLIRTGTYRYSGTGTVSASGQTLTDASASFSTGAYPAAIGHRVYVAGHFTLVVTSVNSNTELGIALWDRDPGPLADVGTATAYYGGPGVSEAMVESRLRYQTVTPLGSVYAPETDEGGYASAFLYADADHTAETVLDYFEAWLSQRRMTLEFSTFLNAIHLELGDTVTMDCPILPASYASVKWEVTGVRVDPGRGQIRLRITEKPAA